MPVGVSRTTARPRTRGAIAGAGSPTFAVGELPGAIGTGPWPFTIALPYCARISAVVRIGNCAGQRSQVTVWPSTSTSAVGEPSNEHSMSAWRGPSAPGNGHCASIASITTSLAARRPSIWSTRSTSLGTWTVRASASQRGTRNGSPKS